MAPALQKFIHEEEEIDNDTPLRYVPIRHIYSSTAPCISASGSSNVMSKKVKARKLVESFDSDIEKPSEKPPPLVQVYRRYSAKKPSVFESLLKRVESDSKNPGKRDGIERGKRDNSNQSDEVLDSELEGLDRSRAVLDSVKVRKIIKKRKKTRNYELLSLGIDSSYFHNIHDSGSREKRDCNWRNSAGKAKCDSSKDRQKHELQKRWVELGFEDVDPHTFIGLSCKVFWPMDDDWYAGSVTRYDSETKQHHVKYIDGDDESLFLSCEKIKFYISREEMQRLNLKCTFPNIGMKGLDYDELLVLAADLDDCREIEPGDIIWAKLTGHAMWPALVMDESHVAACRGLNPKKRGPKPDLGGRSVPVQFFGTHDFARINKKQVISFLKGLFAHFHLKCRQAHFRRSLEEAKMYLSEEKLPSRMLRMQNGDGADECDSASEKESVDSGDYKTGDERMQKSVECTKICPFKIGDLNVMSLGKIVRDSECFQDEQNVWPEGYTAIRKFFSIKDPTICTFYKMEVLRDPESKARPIFRITSDDGAKIKGSTPSVCWKKVYRRIKKTKNSLSNGFSAEVGGRMIYKSGSHMFGFSNPKISNLIQGMCSTSKDLACKFASESYDDLPAGYRPVRVDWKDLDKCSVCHMDEEYENNLFLQCDKCRMMVHARCYGELEPLDGVLWLCNLCRPGAPISLPPCCLCPVIGGAMKPTSDGRWAHLTCAMWVPETFLLDVKRMEPIDGLNRINKDRWKLLCSICGVSYGACIQCSNSTCRVAYHPLCARAAGLCVELEDEDRLHLISVDEDDDQCIRLLSFCKKHRQPSNDRSPAGEKIGQTARQCSSYIPPSNPSGCARTEPYDFLARRGRKEPEILAAASVKRLFVENKPYLVSGYRQNGFLGDARSCNEVSFSSFSSSLQNSRTSQLGTPNNILSMAEKYKYMRETIRKRLAFGKSRIHGFGIFAKLQHRAGDMVIEYTGELVRRPIADKREHFIYNSLVGAGTYMFRIDDERVIDATRAGSIAHLINHSCEPNCYSRVITVQGDEHIIIFAKRDINQWEELTYDYRFFSIDEQLACYCGFPRCRGVVNDIEAEEQVAKIRVPRCELINWTGE